MTSGRQGTLYFKRNERNLGSKLTISINKSFGGYRKTTRLHVDTTLEQKWAVTGLVSPVTWSFTHPERS